VDLFFFISNPKFNNLPIKSIRLILSGWTWLYNLPLIAKTCQGIINLCELPRQTKVYLDLGLDIGSKVGLKVAKDGHK
jgi:hypothetical protein